MGAEELVGRAGVEVASDRAHVDGGVSGEMHAIDVEERTMLVYAGADHGQVGPGADEVGSPGERHEARARSDVLEHVLG